MLRPIVEVLEAYGLFALRIDEIGSGIINQTWKLELDDERTLVLQKVNPVFQLGKKTLLFRYLPQIPILRFYFFPHKDWLIKLNPTKYLKELQCLKGNQSLIYFHLKAINP